MLPKHFGPTMFAVTLGMGCVGALAQDATDAVTVQRDKQSVLEEASPSNATPQAKFQADQDIISSVDATMLALPYTNEIAGGCGVPFDEACGQIEERRRFETGLPGLFGITGCYFGYGPVRGSFEFDDQFLAIDGAWLCVKGGTELGPACAFAGITLAGIDLEPSEVEEGFLALTEESLSCVSLTDVESLVEGVVWVGLSLDLNCSDCCSYVLEGTICVDGLAAHGPLSLFGFAHFQNCFSGEGGTVEQGCDVFDTDEDLDVDLHDASLLYGAAEP